MLLPTSDGCSRPVALFPLWTPSESDAAAVGGRSGSGALDLVHWRGLLAHVVPWLTPTHLCELTARLYTFTLVTGTAALTLAEGMRALTVVPATASQSPADAAKQLYERLETLKATAPAVDPKFFSPSPAKPTVKPVVVVASGGASTASVAAVQPSPVNPVVEAAAPVATQPKKAEPVAAVPVVASPAKATAAEAAAGETKPPAEVPGSFAKPVPLNVPVSPLKPVTGAGSGSASVPMSPAKPVAGSPRSPHARRMSHTTKLDSKWLLEPAVGIPAAGGPFLVHRPR